MNQEVELLSFEAYEEIMQRMAAWARPRKFKSIYAPCRGGWTPAVRLSHLLDNLPVIQHRDEITRGTLIVDDIIDGGKTVQGILSAIGENVEVAVLVFNEKSSFKPDFYGRTKGKTVQFHWETSKTAGYSHTPVT